VLVGVADQLAVGRSPAGAVFPVLPRDHLRGVGAAGDGTERVERPRGRVFGREAAEFAALLGAALHAESPALAAAAAYQVACAFLKNDRLDDAETIALVTAANLNDESPAGLSLRGALTLIAAVIAGRRNDRGEAMERLQRAQVLADQLGEDANHGWTAFGPTNVAIHRVSTAAELGDAASAIAQAEFVDVSSLPSGLLSRRAQVHIDMAWAYTQRRADAEAVVNLLEAERVAPQTLRYNVLVRELCANCSGKC